MFSAQRYLLYISNYQVFSEYSFQDIMLIIGKGLKYDIATVLYINTLFIFLYLLPVSIYNSIFYQFLLKIIFFAGNMFVMLINLIDFHVYYHFRHRLLIWDIQNVLREWSESLQLIDFNIFIKEYLSLSIYLTAFFITAFFLTKTIGKLNFENKKTILSLKISSFASLALITLIFINNVVFQNDNIKKNIYLKSDRKLVPILLNNPYWLISSYFANEKKLELDDSWYISSYNSVNKYDRAASKNKFNNIKLIVCKGKKFVGGTKLGNELYVINNSYDNIFQILDELLFSYPAIFRNGLYKSSYSLKNIESLVDILKQQGYNTKLTGIGYSKDSMELVRNFYRLKNNDNNKDKGKNFELILVKDNSESINLKEVEGLNLKDNSLIITVLFNDYKSKISKLRISKSLFFSSDKHLKFYNDNNLIITQFLDIKPSILHLTGYSKPFVSYGKSLFQRGERCQYHVFSDSSYSALYDNLLLNYVKDQTVSLHKIYDFKFSKYNFADSLAVERTTIENKLQSMLYDFRKRMVSETKKAKK